MTWRTRSSALSFAPLTPVDRRDFDALLAGLRTRLKTEAPDASEEPTHAYASGFSEVQARAILATRRFSAISVDALFREWAELSWKFAALDSSLRDPAALDSLLHAELVELRARHSSARRTFCL